MSPIGRVFVVINLILSVAFVAFTGSLLHKGESFKNQLAEEQARHETTKKELTAQVQDWTAKFNQARDDFTSAHNNAENLGTRNKVLEQEIAQLKDRAETNKANLDTVSRTLGDIRTDLQNTRKDMDSLRDREAAAVSTREKAETEKLALEEKALGLEREIEKLNEKIGGHETTIAQLEEQISSMDAQLKMAIASGFQFGQPLKDIEAQVFNVNSELKTVTLSVGSDHGVTKGYTFDVFRGNEFKGRVRVVDVDAKLCVARITDAYPGRTILKGDSAKTRL